jgi:hypothetical protein
MARSSRNVRIAPYNNAQFDGQERLLQVPLGDARDREKSGDVDDVEAAHTDGSALGADTHRSSTAALSGPLRARPSAAVTRQNAQGARRRIVADRCRPGNLAWTERPPR